MSGKSTGEIREVVKKLELEYRYYDDLLNLPNSGFSKKQLLEKRTEILCQNYIMGDGLKGAGSPYFMGLAEKINDEQSGESILLYALRGKERSPEEQKLIYETFRDIWNEKYLDKKQLPIFEELPFNLKN